MFGANAFGWPYFAQAYAGSTTPAVPNTPGNVFARTRPALAVAQARALGSSDGRDRDRQSGSAHPHVGGPTLPL